MRALLGRIWAAIVRYRRMVAVMVSFGFLQALFTKLPFITLKPLMAEMGKAVGRETTPEPAASSGAEGSILDVADRAEDWFNDNFRDFALWLCRLFGLGDSVSTGMAVVIACGVIALVCGVLGAYTIYIVQTRSRFFGYRIVADLRCELAQHFLSLPLRFFGKQRMGKIISKVTNDTQVMQRSFEVASDNFVLDPLMILFNAGLILFFVPEAIVILLLLIPMMAIPLYKQGKKVQKRSSKSLQALGDSTESLNQILTGIRTVKAYQLEDERMREFEGANATFLDRTSRVLRAKGRSIAQSFVSYQVATALFLVLLGYLVIEKRAIDFDDVAVIIAPLATTYQHVKRLTRAYNVLRESAGALSGIDEILSAAPDAANIGGKPLSDVRGDVELRDVQFSYDENRVLRGLSLRAEAGQTVALVGPSGGGKSTTLDVLLRFHDPAGGAVLVDGVDLRECRLTDYRRHTAVVSQTPFLFHSSLRDNIACGKPGATDEEVQDAARAANIHDFIMTLPDGYGTLAGERGANLSGGQMQRITIARAILRDPSILFLDEATSALDTESEAAVQKALDELRRGRTSFVIAHRLSTIVDADRIAVIDEGVVVEFGTHAELLALDGVYKRMVDQQMRS
ncbi:MAG: ABC transporter ATP-binding protein [Planctomycetota bacterium]